MVFNNLCVLVLWTKVALVFEGLRKCPHVLAFHKDLKKVSLLSLLKSSSQIQSFCLQNKIAMSKPVFSVSCLSQIDEGHESGHNIIRFTPIGCSTAADYLDGSLRHCGVI